MPMPMYWKIKYWKDDDKKRAISRILRLRQYIMTHVPQRTASDTLLLATWNLRDFDSNKFGHGPRLEETFYYIAEVISAFDLVALQEINYDMRPLEKLIELLGPSWDYIATDETKGSSGNQERMVYVFNCNKVQFKHIAGEIVLPKNELIQDAYQAARSPFLVRFQSGWFKFNLCSVHIYYGDMTGPGYKRRVAELNAIAKFIQERAEKDGENYILLGDMNVVNPTDLTMQALTKHNFILPKDLLTSNIDIDFTSNVGRDKHYDQIAFLPRKNEVILGTSKNNAGVLNYYQAVYRDDEALEYYSIATNRTKWPSNDVDQELYFKKEWRTWQMSDHLPLFVELKIDFTEQYLEGIQKEQ